MKFRTVVLFIIFLLSASLLFSDSIFEWGYGDSPQNAKEDALNNLSSRISTSVSSMITTLSVDDSVSDAMDRYIASSIQQSETTFIGLEYGEPIEGNGLWRVSVGIPESSIPLYYDRLEVLADEISTLYSDMDNLDDVEAISYAELDVLLSYLSDFESNRLILTILDSTASDKIPILPVTKSQVEARRMTKLYSDEMSIEQSIEQYDLSAAFGIISEESKADRKVLEERLDKLREENQRHIEEIHKATQERIDEISSLDLQFASDNNKHQSGFLDSLDLISRYTQGLSVISSASKSAIEGINDDFETEASELEDSRMNAAFPEMDKDNQKEIERRREAIQYEIDTEVLPYYVSEINKQFQSSLEMSISNIEKIADESRKLLNSTFSISSLAPEVSVAITGYNNDSFIGYVQVNAAGKELLFDISIPYEDWSGKTIPDYITDYDNYQQYRFIANQWLNILKDNASLLLLELNMHFSYDPVLHGLYIVLDSYSVTRLDTDKRIINNKPSFQIVEVIELPFDLKEVFEYSFNLDNRIAAKFDYEYIVVEKFNESKLEETVNVLDLVSLDLIDSLNSFSAEERAMMGKDEIQKELDSIRKSMLPEERFSNLFIDSKILFEPYASVSFGVADSPYLIRTRLGVELLFPFSVGSIPSKLTSQSFLSASISAGFLNKAITRVEGNISYDSKLGYVGFSAMVDYGILLHFNPSWAVKLTLGGGISYYDSFHFSVSTGCGVLIPAGTGRLDVTLNAEWMHSLSDDSSIRFALIVGYLFKGF